MGDEMHSPDVARIEMNTAYAVSLPLQVTVINQLERPRIVMAAWSAVAATTLSNDCSNSSCYVDIRLLPQRPTMSFP